MAKTFRRNSNDETIDDNQNKRLKKERERVKNERKRRKERNQTEETE